MQDIISMINMKIKSIHRSIIIGIITALLTTSLVIGVYFGVTSSDNNQLLPPFEWDFSSIKALSLQMDERSNYLLATTTESSIIIDNDSSMMVPYFNYSVYSIYSWHNTEADEWMLEIEDYLNNNSDYDAIYRIQPSILASFGPSLNNDLQTIQNQQDVRENYWEEIAETKEPGMLSITIIHIYQDGSMIWLDAFENTVFIRFIRFKEYKGGYGFFSITPEKHEEFEDGRDKYDVFYKAEIPEFFPSYTNAVNVFLEQFY